MREHRRYKATCALLAGAAVVAVAGSAVADDVTVARPGFGYAIDFITGELAAEALLPPPVQKQEAMIVRPGFGYSIQFMSGPDAEALFPVGWAAQRALTKPPQS